MTYLEVKNWAAYQHYGNRCPPWIKLHTRILNDRDFTLLSCASRGLLMQLWVLASENNGKIEHNLEEIRFRLRDGKISELDLQVLIDAGFLILNPPMLADASVVQADACLEERREEREKEQEGEKKHSYEECSSPAAASDRRKAPYSEIVESWNATCGDLLKRVERITDQRKAVMRQRFAEWGLPPLVEAFTKVRASAFLTGQVTSNGRAPFFASFDWTMAPRNFIKVMEGNYDDRPGRSRPRLKSDRGDLETYDAVIEDAGI